jgi:hypothetical protein
MRKLMTAAFALSALFATSGKVHAEVNYPWCIIGDMRTVECYFSSREQCMQDGRNRGFGSQCMPNPFYKPGAPTISGPVNTRPPSQAARPSQTVNAIHSTCTGLKLLCRKRCVPDPARVAEPVLCGWKFCDSEWEHCMKTGWWIGRTAERR